MDQDDEVCFWKGEAQEAFEWFLMVHKVCMNVYRRKPDNMFDLLTELQRAQAMFHAYFNYSNARVWLAQENISMSEMLACQ